MVKKRLPITYDHKIPLGVVSDDPMVFLIYTRLFDNFRIVTDNRQQWLYDLGFDEMVRQLNVGARVSDRIDRLYRSKKFIDLVKQEPKRKHILYAPLDPPYKVNPLTLLMNSPAIAHAYENKRYFRDEFADLIRMPEYVIKHVAELDKATAYHDLREEFGEFVLQDEESYGSKGTFLVKNHDDYVAAVKALKKQYSGRSIVVSKYIAGDVHSTQVCITKYGIFTAGVQKQLMNSKYLCNSKLEGAAKWCGGELGDDYPDIVQHQVQEIATIVGSELSSHGYKGIFGIDLIITPENEVYAIEINARQTGYSFLISDMQLKQGKIPFMLLHALELGNFDYEVKDLDALPSTGRYKKPVSYMIVNNPSEEPIEVTKYVRPGIYRLQGDKLVFEKEAYSIDQLKGENTMLILSRHSEGSLVEPGKRVLKIIKAGKSIANADLNKKSQHVVAVVKKHFNLP